MNAVSHHAASDDIVQVGARTRAIKVQKQAHGTRAEKTTQHLRADRIDVEAENTAHFNCCAHLIEGLPAAQSRALVLQRGLNSLLPSLCMCL